MPDWGWLSAAHTPCPLPRQTDQLTPIMASLHRVMITGASGLLGRAVMQQFSNSDCWEVLGLAHTRAANNLKKLNLLDFDETKRVVEDFKPHVIIHCAAERRPDVVENDEELASKMNVGVTKVLAKAVNSLNQELEISEHFMLYISTDYVFDGTSPPYQPLDEPNPLNKYGKSKLQGEKVMQFYHPDGGILRVPILYGKVEYLKESAVTGNVVQLGDWKLMIQYGDLNEICFLNLYTFP